MQYKTLALALASTAVALPAVAKRDGIQPAPVSQQFGVAFKVDGSYVSANAVKNGSTTILMAERLSVYPGTPAYINSSNPDPTPDFDYVALNFILDDGVYGAFAPEIGDAYGNSGPIYLLKDIEEFKWEVYNGSISHELQAAPNSLYACNGTLETGEPGVFLSFGDYNYGTPYSGPPVGCAFTDVIQNFNIEGGATS